MSIPVQCMCGKDYSVPEERVGKRFHCYICGREVVALLPEASEAIVASSEGNSGLTARRPSPSRPYADEDDPALWQLQLKRRSLRHWSKLRGRIGLGCMLIGMTLCIGGILIAVFRSSLAGPGSGTYIDSGLAPIVLGSVLILWGLRRWLYP
jgi:hypothetical protein